MKTWNKSSGVKLRAVASTAALALGIVTFTASNASALTFNNGSFENSPDFTGWTTLGDTSINTGLGGGPVDGSKQALLTASTPTTSQLESFLGISSGSLDGLGNGSVFNGSAIKQTFTANAGDVLTFKYNFIARDGLPYNDFAFYTLSNSTPVTLSNINTVGNFSSSGYQTFSITIPTTNTYTLGLGVANVGDLDGNSRLLVDGVGDSATAVPFEFSPNLATVAFLGAWGAMIQIKRLAKNRKPIKVSSVESAS